jgi:DNA invertase Pin-like site-specific DNA recombinase
MNYAYIRVSTDKQTVENQRYEIVRFCNTHNLRIDIWTQETISGTKEVQERKLGRLLQKLKRGDLLVCAELSRLGRNMFMVMTILNACMQKGCRVWSVKEGYRLGDDIQSKVLAFAFGMAADIERQFISIRTREALARRKAEGMKLGRPMGSSSIFEMLDRRAPEIRQWLREGRSKVEIAKTLGCSRSTFYRWINLNKLTINL